MDLEEVIIMGEERESGTGDGTSSVLAERSPLTKTRSLSDGGGTPGRKLSPSPLILESHRRTSKDDSSIGDNSTGTPVTPRRPDFHLRGLSLQLPPSDLSPAAAQQYRPAPLSPKLDQSQIYASPTNILPRRSRGLDFSRAATSLHHSTLAEQQSPDSSPTVGGRGMNIPGRRPGEFGAAETTNSLWSMMGNQEKMHISSSLGSGHNVCSDSSSTSDEDDFMDDDMMDEGFVTTPQVSKTSQLPGVPWSGSPAMNSLLSFQQRQRPRKQPKKKARGPLGLGFHSISGGPPNLNLSKSPPNNLARESAHARRESISWAANQLHISGNESDDNLRSQMEMGDGLPGTPSRDNPRGVVRRVVTRRGNLLPKTKGFARIRAALMEEGAPVESEFKREAEVIRQVRESDMDLEPRIPPPSMSQPTTTNSSPTLAPQDPPEDVPDDAMLMDSVAGGLGLSSFKRQAVKNSKGKVFWDTFSESSSNGGGTAPGRTTPPPTASLARGSSAGMSVDDMSMDSPSTCSGPVNSTMNSLASNGIFPMAASTRSSSGHDTPQPGFGPSLTQLQQQQQQQQQQVPTAAEITRRINTKRRRGDDDLDPVSFKRRAVSPGMSVHNSPIMQSPLQRDLAPWGGGAGGPGSSRPGSNGADRPGGSSSGTQSENGRGGGGGGGGKGRVGFQGMVDTNDGITKLSIE